MTMEFASNTEKVNYYKELKKERRKNVNAQFYKRNKPQDNTISLNKSKGAKRAEECRKRKLEMKTLSEHKREQNRIYKRKQRERDRNLLHQANRHDLGVTSSFKNRTEKHRAMKRVKKVLPSTPMKRKELIKSYIEKSPVWTPKSRRGENISESKILDDVKSIIDQAKHRRTDDARAAVSLLSASFSGENVSKKILKSKVAKKLGLPRRRLSDGANVHSKILHSEKACFKHTTRKCRSDKISDKVKSLVYDWWLNPVSSRMTGNKTDIKRKRLAPKVFVSHPIHILEKTQTEVYDEFCVNHPQIKISQRSFERLKPFFVQPARVKDRNTCCCRQHLEIRLLFRRCMEFRRNALKKSIVSELENYPVYGHLSELVETTLCARSHDSQNYGLNCLQRKCNICGVHNFKVMDVEISKTETTENVKWERYEYQSFPSKDGKECRKLILVQKETKPGFMFEYLIQILSDFPYHQYKAEWQSRELQTIRENLPQGHCICIHDFSENFKCIERDELQSSYFQKTEVSLHVTIIYRHPVLEYDMVEESDDVPLISELFFVISDDIKHDQYFTKQVQELVAGYLRSIACKVDYMHEFTDGCSSQYKSRHCMGASTLVAEECGYQTFTRNFFETAHAKGPQDAAGGCIKRKLDSAVLHGHVIQTAKDVFRYCNDNFTIPKSGKYKRRIFRYVSAINRQKELAYKAVSENRKIHQIVSSVELNNTIIVRELSCFSCEACVLGEIHKCERENHIGKCRVVEMKPETKSCGQENSYEDSIDFRELISEGDIIALNTDDENLDYYLMKVTQPCSEVGADGLKDSWGNNFVQGTNVIQGLYYDKMDTFTYKLIKNKPAAVYPIAISYKLCPLEYKPKRNCITLQEDVHLDILSSLWE